MNISDVIQQLINAIKENSDTHIYEEKLSNNLENAYKIKDFYNLPNLNLCKIINQSSDLSVEIASKVLRNYCSINPNGAPILLNYISLPSATFDECCQVISSLVTSPICRQLGEQNKEIDVDWDYELHQKETELKDLREKLKYENIQLPLNYEPNIFKACKNGNFDSVRYMVYKHTNIEVKDSNGCTPLIISIAYDQQEITELLVENGSNIENPDPLGNTPLMIAAAAGNIEIVKYLVSRGANVNASSDSGNTALQYASVLNEKAIVNFLLKKGANKEKRDRSGKTAKDWVRSQQIKNILS